MREDRPLAAEGHEKFALERFPLEMSPEEYAARHAHLIGAFSFATYRYRDGRLDTWIARLGDILFQTNDAPTIRALRERFLSPHEIQEAEQAETLCANVS